MIATDLIIVDSETSGLDVTKHELLEIGAVRVSPDLAIVRGEFDVKIRPTSIEHADPDSLDVNGYSKERWASAVTLRSALSDFARFSEKGMLAGFNVAFDWAFLLTALQRERVAFQFDYHLFDVFSLAVERAWREGWEGRPTLRAFCERLGVAVPPSPHEALADARATLELLRLLRA